MKMVVTLIGIVAGTMMTGKDTTAIAVIGKTTIPLITKARTVTASVSVNDAGVTETRKTTTPAQGIRTTIITITTEATESANLFLKLSLASERVMKAVYHYHRMLF
jgi:hypothetical protein